MSNMRNVTNGVGTERIFRTMTGCVYSDVVLLRRLHAFFYFVKAFSDSLILNLLT